MQKVPKAKYSIRRGFAVTDLPKIRVLTGEGWMKIRMDRYRNLRWLIVR